MVTLPNGETTSGKWDVDWGDGGSGTWYFDTGIHKNPAYGQNGTLYVKYYDNNGNQIGSASVKITS